MAWSNAMTSYFGNVAPTQNPYVIISTDTGSVVGWRGLEKFEPTSSYAWVDSIGVHQ